jgi:hypothetical protein
MKVLLSALNSSPDRSENPFIFSLKKIKDCNSRGLALIILLLQKKSNYFDIQLDSFFFAQIYKFVGRCERKVSPGPILSDLQLKTDWSERVGEP